MNLPDFLQPVYPYHVTIDFELPESPANVHLGMFMVSLDITMVNASGTPNYISPHFYPGSPTLSPPYHPTYTPPDTLPLPSLLRTSRPCLLRFKTNLLHTIHTLFFSPLSLIGYYEEKQRLSLSLSEGAIMPDALLSPPLSHMIAAQVVLSKHEIEIYSAKLRIWAELTTTGYLMKYWPITSFFIGVSIIYVGYIFGFLFLAIGIYLRQKNMPPVPPPMPPSPLHPANRPSSSISPSTHPPEESPDDWVSFFDLDESERVAASDAVMAEWGEEDVSDAEAPRPVLLSPGSPSVFGENLLSSDSDSSPSRQREPGRSALSGSDKDSDRDDEGAGVWSGSEGSNGEGDDDEAPGLRVSGLRHRRRRRRSRTKPEVTPGGPPMT
eukprot:TRINITY_DN14111_c0_g1_i2.p1 TRINITY_DN14111_c0_g1~~TRINITY_DN14111_c0_g1_i2.p1  ORF type:complete len:381 (+),score=66.35 TRINITY_DN14111_c0_g1_i2:96-1238(+)